PVALPAVVRPETGLRTVRRRGRCPMAATVGAGGLPGSRMRVRQQDAGAVPETLRSLPPRRPAGHRCMDRFRAARDTPGSPDPLPDPRLRPVGPARWRVLPRPRIRLVAARLPGPR